MARHEMTEHTITAAEPRPTIADILLAHGFVDDDALTAALEEASRTRQPLGQILVEAGAITRLELASALAEQWSDPSSSSPALPRAAPPPSERSPAHDGSVELQSRSDSFDASLQDELAELRRWAAHAEQRLTEAERIVAPSFDPEALEKFDSSLAELADLAELVATTRTQAADTEGRLTATSAQLEALTDGVEQAVASLQAGAEELAGQLAALASGAGAAPTDDDVTDLRAAVEELQRLQTADLVLSGRVDELAESIALLMGDESVALVRADLEEIRSQVVSDGASLADLHRIAAELVARPPVDPALEARLDGLASELVVERLAQRLEEVTARLDANETGASAGEGAGSDVGGSGVHASGEPDQELERLRMAIERMSLHLGEQERAIAEVFRSRGAPQRLDELEARIEDVAAVVADAGGTWAGPGERPPDAAHTSMDVRALVRRLDTAEAALDAERDKLLTKLERIASALDWRMRRLESTDELSD